MATHERYISILKCIKLCLTLFTFAIFCQALFDFIYFAIFCSRGTFRQVHKIGLAMHVTSLNCVHMCLPEEGPLGCKVE